MSTPSRKALGTRAYEFADQERFALLSGDFNPAHLDTLAARRELFGDVVVHGMHGVLQVMEAYFAVRRGTGVEGVRLRKVRARFPGPIFLRQRVDSFAEDQETEWTRLQSWHGDRLVLEVQLQWEQMTSAERTEDRVAPPEEQRRTPSVLSLEELEGRAGELALYLDEALAQTTFPNLVNLLPLEVFAELLAVTRLVGMVCPGLRSILSTVDLELNPRDGMSEGLAYEVTGVDLRFSMVKLAVQGPSVSGSVDTFYRPAPQRQPNIGQVAKRIRSDECATQCALIIGGSRGLGEITAKLVAAGGGHAILTYHRGREDAEKVAAEIADAGLLCEVRPLDVAAPETPLAVIASEGIRPSHVYYFASPKIFVSKGSLFDKELFATFAACYVDGFYKTYRACRSHWDQELVFFYPSTMALTERVKDLAEYTAAKAAGESLAGHLARFDPKLSVLTLRLPRIATDQTTTLTPYPAGDALDVMLDVIRKLSEKGSTE